MSAIWLDTIDFDAYIRSKTAVVNDDGSRGRWRWVYVFDCPLCDDTKARGFANLQFRTAGCFNVGCDAEPRLRGGLVRWAQLLEGFASRWEAIVWLKNAWPRGALSAAGPPRAEMLVAYDDWVRFPDGLRLFDSGYVKSPLMVRGAMFASRKWGVQLPTLQDAGVGMTARGRYARRLIFPIIVHNVVVGFQARAIVPGVERKYLMSKRGERSDREAECGRAAEAMLYGIDDVLPGETVVLVEGIGDALRYNQACAATGGRAVALLGVALTGEKAALLKAMTPGKILVAMDAEPAAQARALTHVRGLRSWGLQAVRAEWVGGKDAGEGATLREVTNAEEDSVIGELTL